MSKSFAVADAATLVPVATVDFGGEKDPGSLQYELALNL
jgi:hypothetical protein